VDKATVLQHFEDPGVVEHYKEAAAQLGLWKSEKLIFQRLFQPDQSLLELGCGGGRIAIGLWELGYRHILGIDYSKPMVDEARKLNRRLEYGIAFQKGDATALDYEDNLFDGAIFGFNGLMQIPTRELRVQAMKEIWRVIRPGAWFVFTSHDRQNPKYKKFWHDEKLKWRKEKQQPELDEFGDRYGESPWGLMYIHVPETREVRRDLKEAGFRVEADVLRSQFCEESLEVQEFSDDCRFWIAQKPVEVVEPES
jgi:ubiquinone/menaquinone biosynthesis C-methylase UbiE